VVWQWQRNRDRRNRRGRNPDLGVGPATPAAPAAQAAQAAQAANPEPARQPSRAVGPLSDPEFLAGLRPIPAGSVDTPAPWPASDIFGVSPSGDPIEVHLADHLGRLLLAFLNTNCGGCEEFWTGLRDPDAVGVPTGTSVVAITKGPASLSSADVRMSAAGTRVPVVMSDQVWIDYRVLGYPFFVLVDTTSRLVVGETVGLGWDDVLSITGPPH
jgi:hypothetical protein